jgi:N utilization substance protein A
VVAELGGEKIDVIPWSEDPEVFVANALSPAQVVNVEIDEEERIASVTVPERMLSLAIGREGQNARLAAKLTGWRIDIRSETGAAPADSEDVALPGTVAEPDEPEDAAEAPAAEPGETPEAVDATEAADAPATEAAEAAPTAETTEEAAEATDTAEVQQ